VAGRASCLIGCLNWRGERLSNGGVHGARTVDRAADRPAGRTAGGTPV